MLLVGPWENERIVGCAATTARPRSSACPASKNAQEKGGVEGEIGRFRRRHLTPVPRVESLAALNEAMAAADVADDARRRSRPRWPSEPRSRLKIRLEPAGAPAGMGTADGEARVGATGGVVVFDMARFSAGRLKASG